MIQFILIVVSALVVGCSQSEQPWSYAPCYIEQTTSDHQRSVAIWDCPPFDGIHRWAWYPPTDIFPTEDGYYPLFTLQEKRTL